MNLPLTRLAPVAGAVLAVAALGCAANRPELTCPRAGGPVWTEVRSPHFIVETDLSEAAARRMTEEVEAARQALVAALGAQADDGAAPIEVVVFERDSDMDKTTARPSLSGYFTTHLESDVELQPVVVTAGGLDEETKLTLQHELTHEIVRHRTVRVPWWLGEGLAETFSTLRIDGKELVIGEPPPRSDFWEAGYSILDGSFRIPKVLFPLARAPSLDQLLAADGHSFAGDNGALIHYTAAWKLVHVLRGDTNPSWAPRFAAMMADLMKGTDGFDAFAHAYKGVLFSEISAAYQAYLPDHREYPSTAPYAAPPAPALTARSLSDGEVHGLWARLATEHAAQLATAELEKGFVDDPESLELRYVRASIHLSEKGGPAPLDDIRLLRAKEPNNPRYLLLDLRRALNVRLDGAELSDEQGAEILALSTRLGELGTSPAQRATSLQALVAMARYEEAITLGAKAVRADPSCELCFTGYASALLEAGRHAEALDAAQSALALLPERYTGPRLGTLREIIARSEAEQKKAAPAPAPAAP